jgi:hypothetical protein
MCCSSAAASSAAVAVAILLALSCRSQVAVDESYDATLRLVGAGLDLQGANSRPGGLICVEQSTQDWRVASGPGLQAVASAPAI